MALQKSIDPEKLSLRVLENQPGHDVIYAAARGLDGRIYLGLSSETGFPGAYAKLVVYDPAGDDFREIADLAKLIRHERDGLRHPHSKIHTTICVAGDGRVLLTTHMTAPPLNDDFYHYWHVYNDPARCFLGSHLIVHDPRTGSTEDVGLVIPKGGARWMTYNPEREELYVTGFLDSHFYVIRLKTGEVRDLGRISHYDFMGPCYCADGRIYTSDHRGNFLRYDPDTETIARLPLVLPRVPWGIDNHVGVFALVPGPGNRKLYGTVFNSQYLFEFDPSVGKYGRIRNLGTLGGVEDHPEKYAVGRWFARTLAVGSDGLLYISSRERAVGELMYDSRIFTLDPETGASRDYGLVQLEGFPGPREIVCSCMGQDDTFYFSGDQIGGAAGAPVLYMFHRDRVPVPVKPADVERFRGLKETPRPRITPRLSYHAYSRDCNAVFVSRGTFYAQDQGVEGSVPVIPRGECAITALFQDAPSGVVLGATTGRRNHLFVFFPLVKIFLPLTVFGRPDTETRAIAGAGDRMYFGTFSRDARCPGNLYSYDLAARRDFFAARENTDRGEFYSYWTMPDVKNTAVDDHGEIVPGEGIRTLVSDGEKLYGLSFPGGKFFVYDPKTGVTRTRDIFDGFIRRKANISEVMLCLGEKIFFSGHHGKLIAYDIAADAFTETALKIPCGAGREYLNTLSAVSADGHKGFYGGTASDGMIFHLDAEAMTLTGLGKPASEGKIRALVLNHDGILWGIAGNDWEVAHLFSFDPGGAGVHDCGIIRAKIPRSWVSHRCDAMIRGLDGELYLGESDDLSHLLIYYPPVSGRGQQAPWGDNPGRLA